jgi:hypothetical protein
MCRFKFLFILFFAFIIGADLSVTAQTLAGPFRSSGSQQDTLIENQNLFNGRIWRNLYYLSEGNQFLFSNEFLPGSLTINGKRFTDIFLKYDIYNDEILTPVDQGGILQLNKEMVDSFSLSFKDKTYKFIRMQDDSIKGSKKYFNVLYQGKTALYLKYTKKIDKLTIDGGNEKFYQLSRIYFVKDNVIYMINSKSDLIKALIEKKEMINPFIKKNRLYVSEKEPESFIPVIRYYDNISR